MPHRAGPETTLVLMEFAVTAESGRAAPRPSSPGGGASARKVSAPGTASSGPALRDYEGVDPREASGRRWTTSTAEKDSRCGGT